MSSGSDPRPIDYLAVGHVTLDRQPDGSVLPGGTVLYGAVLAARMGLRSKVVTSGNPVELEAPLRPYRHEIDVELQLTAATTTFTNRGVGSARRQVVNQWAGPIDLSPAREQLARARIVHLGPVAAEIDPATLPPMPPGALMGATPQGWLRAWDTGGVVRRVELRLPPELLARIDVLVLSESEREQASGAIAAVRAHQGVVAVTLGERGCEIQRGQASWYVPAAHAVLVDDTGAGDVFAAALLIALAEGLDPRAAARQANAAAGISIGGLGASRVPTRAAVTAHLAPTSRGLNGW